MAHKTGSSAKMSEEHDIFRPDPRIQAKVSERLAVRGFSPEAIDALMRFDVANFHWRRLYEKGEFQGKMIEGLEAPLEPAMLQGLIAIARLNAGVGLLRPEEPTIGRVAELMEVDPSRASRIVAELVSREVVVRRPSQSDARKSVIDLTPKGWKYISDFMTSKWRLTAQIFEDWPEEDIERFSVLFQRYVLGVARVAGSSLLGEEK